MTHRISIPRISNQDYFAMRSGLWEKIREVVDSDAEAFAEYDQAVNLITCPRRGPDPMGGLLYILLGCSEYNAGNNGIGATERFSLEQIQNAIELLDKYVESRVKITRPKDDKDFLSGMLGIESELLTAAIIDEESAVREREFLNEAMKVAADAGSVTIFFN